MSLETAYTEMGCEMSSPSRLSVLPLGLLLQVALAREMPPRKPIKCAMAIGSIFEIITRFGLGST